jgi:uncharacterized protein YndB with AHSA1/START domain
MKNQKITVETLISAPAKTVWKYFTTPEDIMAWNNASDDWHSPRAQNDLRPGGKFNYRMESRDGKEGFDFEGTFVEVVPNKVLTYTIADGRAAEVSFDEEGRKTRVVTTFEAEKENPVEMQKGGWQSILDNFKKYVEAQKK